MYRIFPTSPEPVRVPEIVNKEETARKQGNKGEGIEDEHGDSNYFLCPS